MLHHMKSQKHQLLLLPNVLDHYFHHSKQKSSDQCGIRIARKSWGAIEQIS